MFLLAIPAVIAAALAVFFSAVAVGMRRAHPTDLAVQRPSLLGALARRATGLYVRSGEPGRHATPLTGCERVAR